MPEIGAHKDGVWHIEGHGVEPDVTVDNNPSETHRGADAQLDAAVRMLLAALEDEPLDEPPMPSYPLRVGMAGRGAEEGATM